MSQNDQKPEDVEGVPTLRELREYTRGNLDVDHQDALKLSGLVDDPSARRKLTWMAQNYEPRTREMPSNFWQTEFAKRALQKYGTEAAHRAIRDGDVHRAGFLSGLPGYKSDVSGLHATNKLADWLINSEQCKLIYLAALMGRGKTDFALLLLEVIQDHYRRVQSTVDVDVPTPEFATNFEARTPEDVDATVHEFHRYSEFLEWAERGGSDDVRWFIFDEASTELTAQSGANAQDVAERFAPFVKKMRKHGIDMVVIGHDRGDVHPAIRSIASFVDKKSQKTADIYEGIKSREPFGHQLSISGIPPTSWDFETDDTADWEWDAEPGEDVVDLDDADVEDLVEQRDDLVSEAEWREWRDERLAAMYQGTDMTYEEVGKFFGVSGTTVSRACNSVEPEVEPAPASPGAVGD